MMPDKHLFGILIWCRCIFLSGELGVYKNALNLIDRSSKMSEGRNNPREWIKIE